MSSLYVAGKHKWSSAVAVQPGGAEERDGDELWRLAALQRNGGTKFILWTGL